MAAMATSSARRGLPDPTIYPEEERVGESMLQRWILELLRPLLAWWLNVRHERTAFVGADQFIYWRQYDSSARVAPDLYVLPGVDPLTAVRTWKLWLDRVVPSFALEIVSEAWEKDYMDAPVRYEAVGVPELVIFDPHFETHREGVRWQVYRRVGKRGLIRVEAANADRVRSKSLGCWLRAIGEGQKLRVRIAEGAMGDVLVPTAEERAEAERAEKEAALAAKQAALATEQAERAAKEAALAAREAERSAKEAALAAKQAEQAAKEAALTRVAELERELRRRQSSRAKR
ncbi:MAG: Uma2 family endonuclease [Deltaproteobacteria bacterium]|nr:Uma2 family endonuclease [Deltaproteobacteria bacterium]